MTELIKQKMKGRSLYYKLVFSVSEFEVIDENSDKDELCKRKVLLLLDFYNLSNNNIDGLLENNLFESDGWNFNEMFLENVDISEMEVGIYLADATVYGGCSDYLGEWIDAWMSLSNINLLHKISDFYSL